MKLCLNCFNQQRKDRGDLPAGMSSLSTMFVISYLSQEMVLYLSVTITVRSCSTCVVFLHICSSVNKYCLNQHYLPIVFSSIEVPQNILFHIRLPIICPQIGTGFVNEVPYFFDY